MTKCVCRFGSSENTSRKIQYRIDIFFPLSMLESGLTFGVGPVVGPGLGLVKVKARIRVRARVKSKARFETDTKKTIFDRVQSTSFFKIFFLNMIVCFQFLRLNRKYQNLLGKTV